MKRLRLWISKHLGFFIPSVGQWHEDPLDYRWRRLLPSGDWEYRDMSQEEAAEERRARAW